MSDAYRGNHHHSKCIISFNNKLPLILGALIRVSSKRFFTLVAFSLFRFNSVRRWRGAIKQFTLMYLYSLGKTFYSELLSIFEPRRLQNWSQKIYCQFVIKLQRSELGLSVVSLTTLTFILTLMTIFFKKYGRASLCWAPPHIYFKLLKVKSGQNIFKRAQSWPQNSLIY